MVNASNVVYDACDEPSAMELPIDRRRFQETNVGTSRRKFIKSATAGVSLAWKGVRVTAGSDANGTALPLPTAHKPISNDAFLYGSQFYRPPSPRRAQRRDMLRSIAEGYKFNTIRIWPNWDYVNPQPDEWIFDEVEEVMSYCDEFGLKVLCGFMFELAPWWLEQRYPGARFTDAKGQPVSIAGSPNNVTGGWPGLCFDWEPVREAGAK